jgi:hypothetical protein
MCVIGTSWAHVWRLRSLFLGTGYDSAVEVSTALPLLDSVGAKMLKLEEVVGGQLEADDCAMVEIVAEHVLICFWSWDLRFSLEPVAQGPIAETEEGARAGIQDTTKMIAALFERQPIDA